MHTIIDFPASYRPPGRTVLNEILGDLVEPLVGRDDLVVLA